MNKAPVVGKTMQKHFTIASMQTVLNVFELFSSCIQDFEYSLDTDIVEISFKLFFELRKVIIKSLLDLIRIVNETKIPINNPVCPIAIIVSFLPGRGVLKARNSGI